MTPVLSTDLLNANPTSNPFNNATITTQLKTDMSTLGLNAINGFSQNIDNFMNSPVLPNLNLPSTIGGIIGDLLKMSGPMILMELFSQVADIIVNKVFIGILGLDKISLTNSSIDNLIQSLTGFSVTELQNMFNFNIDQTFTDPNFLSNFITTLFSKINLNSLDYSNSTSIANSIGIGTVIKGLFNVEDSLGSSFASILGISTININEIDRQSIKSNLEREFLFFILSKIANEAITYFESLIDHDHPYGAKFIVAVAHLLCGVSLLNYGMNVQQKIDELGGDIIIADTSFVNAVQELSLGFFDVVNIGINIGYDTCKAILDTFDIIFSMAKILVSITDVVFSSSSPLGKFYALATIFNSLIEIDERSIYLAKYVSKNPLLKEISGLASLFREMSPIEEKWLPILIGGTDVVQLLIGEIYFIQM